MAETSKFEQRILIDRPPVYQRCIEVFGSTAARHGVIFSYGHSLYNPTGVVISKALIAHEAAHGERQVVAEGGVEGWWERYFTDKKFRLAEEVVAHRAEYLACVRRHGHRPADLRNIAGRLAGDLYGRVIKQDQAKHAILTGALP